MIKHLRDFSRFKWHYATSYLFALATLPLIIWSPPSHSPDLNYYVSVALRISAGRFCDSIDGLYGPLFSWLLAPLISAGIDPLSGARILQYLSYVALLISAEKIFQLIGTPRLLAFTALALTTLELAYLQVVIMTADLLAASLFLYASSLIVQPLLTSNMRANSATTSLHEASYRYKNIIASLIAGLGFYAKPMILPCWIAAVTSFIYLSIYCKDSDTARDSGAPLKPWLLLTLPCLMITLPWIIILSIRYQTPIFTAQQLLPSHPAGRYDYSPNNQQALINPETLNLDAYEYGDPATLSLLERLQFSAAHLFRTITGLFIGVEVFFLWLLFLVLALFQAIRSGTKQFQQVLAIAAAYTAVHFLAWGAHLRYFYAILPIVNLLVVTGANRSLFLVTHYLPRARKLMIITLMASTLLVVLTISTAVIDDIRSKKISLGVIRCGREIPELQQTGILTGNGDSPFPAMIAYSLRREFWNVLYPNRKEATEKLRERLSLWRVSQIIWFGDSWKQLDSLANWQKTGPYSCNNRSLYIYSRTP